MSPPERKLWVRIRRCQLGGLRFRRQHPIGQYAADFYCHEARLVVELDGDRHRDRRAEDAARDAFMRDRGIEVLRISVSDFERNVPSALERICRAAVARIDEAGKKR
jgi:very-short-patch-repair endonuclease